jgi:hypothetical protein
MNSIKLIGIFGILLVCLQNAFAKDYGNSVVINVGLYENYNDCISKTNNLYEYNKSLYLKCNCIQSNDCYNKLIESAKFKSYFFYYDNVTIPLYLYELNFKDQCYRFTILSGKPDLYVNNEMDFSQFCGGLIIVTSLLIIFIITITILSINYCITTKNKTNRNKLLLNSQPTYKALS